MEISIKERIKSKADEMFFKYGIRSVTMDEIAKQLGISKKTIYQTYRDKDEIVDEVINELIHKNEKNCRDYTLKAKDAIHEGFLAMEMMQKMFENLNPNILYDLERNHPKTFIKFQQHKYKFLFHSLMENIKKGKSEGLYREDFVDEVAAKLRLENMMLPFNLDLFPKNKYMLASLQKQLIEFHMFSMATVKGHKLILKYKAQHNKKN